MSWTLRFCQARTPVLAQWPASFCLSSAGAPVLWSSWWDDYDYPIHFTVIQRENVKLIISRVDADVFCYLSNLSKDCFFEGHCFFHWFSRSLFYFHFWCYSLLVSIVASCHRLIIMCLHWWREWWCWEFFALSLDLFAALLITTNSTGATEFESKSLIQEKLLCLVQPPAQTHLSHFTWALFCPGQNWQLKKGIWPKSWKIQELIFCQFKQNHF